ncbi:hypothetical protein FA13DRAFT_871344 [Coprinellus micaceus]|uniref:DUF6533 domain-containing protein n=1 Tax=Coprinellus micaceus TaxID=71717 RepID=A0A4Y7RZY5_COPMI|nr:hypothetical protein FA13DRAFT_871344 [Coprinellus micaceus]
MASPLSPERVAALVEVVRVNRIVDSIGVVPGMFDYIHTFPREVKYMWRGRLSLPKALFLFVRYYIFAHSMMRIAYHHDTSLSGPLCNFPFSRNASMPVSLRLKEPSTNIL